VRVRFSFADPQNGYLPQAARASASDGKPYTLKVKASPRFVWTASSQSSFASSSEEGAPPPLRHLARRVRANAAERGREQECDHGGGGWAEAHDRGMLAAPHGG